MESAPALAGSSIPLPKPSSQDFARLLLSLSGSREQWLAVAGSTFSAATVYSVGSLPGPTAPELVAVLSACSSERVSAPGVGSPAGGASATGSSGQRECSRESPHSEQRRRCSSSGERCPSRVRSVVGVGLLPLPVLLVWLARPPPLRSLLRVQVYRRA